MSTLHEGTETQKKLVSKLHSSSLHSNLAVMASGHMFPLKANSPQAQPGLLCPWASSLSSLFFSGKTPILA